ncbi:P2X purinoceptor 7-like [Alosa alosa]|uniref:P2X purinoceptor 7-like n=1 Tax=Alosa alosa TaxID=278164 RepID=UPI0020154CB3|nr:P2X purinoceptor 7-like [Alosa alosa]
MASDDDTELIEKMSELQLRKLAGQLFARQPGLVFDALSSINDSVRPPSESLPVGWCRCGNCREMATDAERKCCGQRPALCISQTPHFSLYCLEDGYLRLHRQYRDDVLVFDEAREPGEDNREYRYAAYRQFIFWQHGALGRGNRRSIPSCCIWRIRDKYPDPHGQYTGFLPHL